MNSLLAPLSPDAIKGCCAALYASDWARLLLGESYHPGGLALTQRLGTLLALRPDARVLDVAAGRGSSAIHLARHFGWRVLGVDYAAANVAAARAAAREAGVSERVEFRLGDAEQLPCDDGAFDAVICECAYCTFPDKRAAAREFARVLRPGGRVGLSDLTRNGMLPPELDDLLGWVACIADARPIAAYTADLAAAGLVIERVEAHDEALVDLVQTVQRRLVGADLLVKLQKLDLPGVDLARIRALARGAAEAVRAGTLGYALLIGSKAAE